MRSNIQVAGNVAFHLIKQAAIFLPPDVKSALLQAYNEETSQIGKTQLKAILDNIALAEAQQSPICQDTGTIVFYVKAGASAEGLQGLEKALIAATRKATADVPLRPNAVDPFIGMNSCDNVGRFVPLVHWEVVQGGSIEISVMLKGGGSENASVLGMLSPGEGLAGLKRFVVDAVVQAGGQPCPPTILGVAVGGGADEAMFLAKKALLRPLRDGNLNADAAALEHELLAAVNMTGVGPMGLGGKTSVLGVKLDFAFRHPASFPVAVVFSCWACRRASAKIGANGEVEYLNARPVGAN